MVFCCKWLAHRVLCITFAATMIEKSELLTFNTLLNMKKIQLVAAVLLTMAQAWAAGVDQTTAQAMAQRFLQYQAATGRMMAPATGAVMLSYTEKGVDNRPVYYVFNSDAVFVIVSADDRAQEILAYGDGNIDDVASLPENMRYWLGYYKRQLEFLQTNPDVQVKKQSLQAPQRAGTSVTPLISANWSQNAPYWNECPAYGTDTCYTGCPATSVSMVFHYWKYPKQQTPAVPSYETPSYGVTLPELPPTVFDWDNMLDDYTNGYTQAQASAVAHLMRYIGQAEQMDYTVSGSGAYLNDMLRAVKFFEYDQNAQMLFKSDELGYENYSDTQWGNLIQTELLAGRPIVYCAYDNITGSGHAFNVDGYDAEADAYHINWGWNGRGNGYFVLNAFTYNDYTFGTAQQMIIGIQPPAGYQAPRLQAYPTTVNLQAYIGKPSTAVISLKGTNLTGDVTLTLNDPDGVFGLDATSVPQSVAEDGTDIKVTYAPQAVGSSTASITCTSSGANTLTIVLNGDAPLEIYPPVMKPANESAVTLTSFRAEWIDETPVANVTGYTLEVQAKPNYMLLEEADFSDLPKMSPTNQASHAADYLPDGWSFTGTEFNLEGGCVMPRRNGVIKTDALQLMGYDKVTVMVTARSYGSWGDPSELTVSTSLASELLTLPFSYSTIAVVLDCAEGDQIAFTAGYYPMIQKIQIYAGDATGATLAATESGDANYRLVTGITGKSYVVKNLAEGGTFFYRVKAQYVDGSESEWSESQIVTLMDGGHPYDPGDVNHDGKVSISDVTALIDYLLGVNDDACATCADVTGEGNISIADVTRLIDMLLGN